LRTRKQAHTPKGIHDAMICLRQQFPNAGEKDAM
jgi:hypothetical protein